MRVKSILAAAVVSGMMTMSASAAFTVTSVRSLGTNANSGNDIIKFYAKYDSVASPEAVAGALGLQGVKATLTTTDSTGFIFRMVNLDGSPQDPDTLVVEPNDADVLATQTPKTTARSSVSSAIGSTIRVWDFNNNAALPGDAAFNAASVTPSQNTNPNPGPAPAYVNLKSFRVEGVLLNPQSADHTQQRAGTDTNAKVANAALAAPDTGAIWAIAVVKHGAPVTADYILTPDQGGVTTGSISDPAPEPATIGLLSVGAIGVLARRRRKA